MESLSTATAQKQQLVRWQCQRNIFAAGRGHNTAESSVESAVEEAASVGDELAIYQGAADGTAEREERGNELSAFFAGETTVAPERVSDVCLVNDHYILVKMPMTTCCPLSDHSRQGLSESPANANMDTKNSVGVAGLSKLLQGKRNRRVSPIVAETEAIATPPDRTPKQASSYWLVGGNDAAALKSSSLEVFNATTKIRHSPGVTRCTTAEAQSPSSATVRRVRIKSPQQSSGLDETSIFGSPVPPLQPDGSLHTSLRNVVHLESHGFIVTPLRAPQPDRGASPAAVQQQFDATPIMADAQRVLKQKLLLRRRFNAIRWLLKPFRARPPSPLKRSPEKQQATTPPAAPATPPPKIHAVVFKTYFVRWDKPPSPPTRGPANVRQVKISGDNADADDSDATALPRCHSALF